MKREILPLVFFLITLSLCAEGAREHPFTAEEFDVDIYRYPYMILRGNDNPARDDAATAYTFMDADDRFELRYGFFTQTEEPYVENIRRSFALFIIPIIHHAAGFEVDLHEVELYDSRDVAEEYYGDIGVSVFIPAPPSDYGGGYAFMLLSFFFKIDQGIVMQTVLFDDIEFAGTDEFAEVTHSFRFHD